MLKSMSMFCLCIAAAGAMAQSPVNIQIDATAKRHPISPLIYGVAFASADQLKALNSPLNRSGGNATSCYNWKLNASNRANDWYFESIAEKGEAPGEAADSFIGDSKAGGAQAMITVPLIDYIAKLGPNRASLGAYSVAKYGPQQKTDPWHADFGNGVKPDGTNIISDPNDAYTPNSPEFQKGWVEHLKEKWGAAKAGGVDWYLMDNEMALWNSTHRAARPKGLTMDEERDLILKYADMVKSVDPDAKVLAPEEWGWTGYIYSASDSAYGAAHNWKGPYPDRTAHNDMDIMPWLLDAIRKHDIAARKRSLDVFTLHIYPQGGDGGDDVSPKIQELRNRSTRTLWDPNYKDESWINDKVQLIPRMKKWVADNYPGTKIGITEYNWGAEKHISGALAQADLLGIFGREGLDIATRWTCPGNDTQVFHAMQMYRNYDGKHSSFGDISVSCTVPDPDKLSAFAALRNTDKALTIMTLNKSTESATIRFTLEGFKSGPAAQRWQLTSANAIAHTAHVPLANGVLNVILPAQSITLYVLPAGH